MEADQRTGSSEVIPNPRKSLGASASWIIAGNASYSLVQWLCLILFARFGSVEMMGVFALALAVSVPIFQLLGFQLRSLLATEVSNEYSFSDYFFLRVVSSLLGLAVLIPISITLGGGMRFFLVTMLVGIAKSTESITDILYGLFQQTDTMEFMGKSLILHSLCTMVLTGSLLIFTGDILLGSLGYAFGAIVPLLMYDLPKASFLSGKVSKLSLLAHGFRNSTRIRSLLDTSFPLGIVSFVGSLTAMVPRYTLAFLSGNSTVAIFVGMSQLPASGTTLVYAFGQAASPRLAASFVSHNTRSFASLLCKLVGISAAGAVFGLLIVRFWGFEIVSILYPGEFSSHMDSLWILTIAWGASFVSSILGFGLTAARQIRVQTPIAWALLALMVLACFVLVPGAGILGAAWAMLASSTLGVVLKAWFIRGAISTRIEANEE